MQHREVMDEGDIAQDYQDKHNRAAVDRVLAEARHPVGPGAEFCEDCGEPIPEKRQKAEPGCTRCVVCKRRQERMRSGQ